ncbi:MAG: hypothetical protein M1814_003219 [Vezdaea aestivalis]|nr:MAG: hypothetical protein M1814_003219 [Vezdaea aestivalis]
MGAKRKQSRRKLPSSTRHPADRKPGTSLTSKATNAIIRDHHVLRKRVSRARDSGRNATKLEEEVINDLETYQRASLLGQSKVRGGDTSKVLVGWLKALKQHDQLLNMLEIGSLDINNDCSKSKMFDMTRIDLKSRHTMIQEQDFMERPLPEAHSEDRFDIISLSLVLNFVSDPKARGDMLSRASLYLRKPNLDSDARFLPCLFLVLPAPCITNSRYLTEHRLSAIMNQLGYKLLERKLTSKLIYFLWHYVGQASVPGENFRKIQVHPGKSRNNYAIVIE